MSLDDKHDVGAQKSELSSAELEKLGKGDHGGLDDSGVGLIRCGCLTSLLTPGKLPNYHDKETTRILRKVDYRLLPMLTLLYVLAFLDRGEHSTNARTSMLRSSR